MKLDIKEIYSLPGSNCNEDVIASSDTYLFVIDGATGLSKAHVTDELSDARWFANSLKDGICEAFKCDDKRDIKDIIYEIIANLAMQYQDFIHKKGLKVPPDYPSAGIALFKINNDKLQFYGLGDCVGVIKLKDGQVIMSCDDVLPKLDEKSIKTMVNYLKDEPNASLFDMKDKAMDVILKNRMKRNQKDGYMILDLSNKGTKANRELVFNLDEVDSIYVMSDGFAQLVETFKIYKDYDKLTTAINDLSLKELTNILFKAQEKDRLGHNYPRLKFRDDTTSGWAKIIK